MACIRCAGDVTDVMGMVVFVVREKGGPLAIAPEDSIILCINCGKNGANVLSRKEVVRLTGVSPDDWSSIPV